MKKYLTVDEAAEMLRIKKDTLYVWICKRKISSISLGKRTLFEESKLIEWIESKNRESI